MEAKHEESPKCKRVKTGNKIRGNHENIAPSLWSKYCKLRKAVKKLFFLEYFLNKGGGGGWYS